MINACVIITYLPIHYYTLPGMYFSFEWQAKKYAENLCLRTVRMLQERKTWPI